MRKFCQLIALLAIVCFSNTAYSQYDFLSVFGNLSVPMPFDEIGQVNNTDVAAASTGYYFMDASYGNNSNDKWKPSANPTGTVLLPLTYEPHLWYRIYPGPRSVPRNERESGYDPVNNLILPPTTTGKVPAEGYRYFRNPAQYERYLNPLDNDQGIDSVRHAIAGPIPIGFAFYMNGLRYDSFYVSGRGIIALSNRRYLYDGEGRRAIPPNKTDCYDPMSADWPFPNNVMDPDQGRRHLFPGSVLSTNPLYETTEDNYGFVNIACGGNPMNPTAGIRNYIANGDQVGPIDGLTPPTQQPGMSIRLLNNVNAGGAFISPMEGPVFLPQWNETLNRSDDRGQVWYKRSSLADKLIIYFVNVQLDAGIYSWRPNESLRTEIFDGRPNTNMNCVSGCCQVELNRIDSSITFRYGGWQGNTSVMDNAAGSNRNWAANEMFQPLISIAIGGYARHKSYNTKFPETYVRSEINPWGGQYMQYTQDFNGHAGTRGVGERQIVGAKLSDNRSTKFKQWKNSLRLVDIQYFVRAKEAGATAFNQLVITEEVQDAYNNFEMFAGHDQLGQMQPVAIIQNLTNDIQSPSGVNFVEQDFQFQARVLVRNRITDAYIYNRYSKVSKNCLYAFFSPSDAAICNQPDPYASIRYSTVTKDPNTGNYIVDPKPQSQVEAEGINGIPPYGFVQVRCPVFVANEFLANHIGYMELATITEPIDPITGALIGDEWPFDDTSKINFWVINRMTNFRSNGEFHFDNLSGYYPDITKWVHASFAIGDPSVQVIGAYNKTTNHPLPPIELTPAMNNPNRVVISPMYEFRRKTVNEGGTNVSKPSKLTSFPIDMRNRNGSILTLGTQRGKSDSSILGRGWADSRLYGPEARVTFMNDYDAVLQWNQGTQRYDQIANISGRISSGFGAGPARQHDFNYLAIEYLKPSIDGVKNITNTGPDFNVKDDAFNKLDMGSADEINETWRFHPYWVNGTIRNDYVVKNAPALAIFGGGGYWTGWAYADGRSYYPVSWNGGVWATNDKYGGSGIAIVNRSVAISQRVCTTMLGTNNQFEVVGGLRPNPYDDGFDFEFYRYSIAIPDYFMEVAPDLGKNFRFRIKMIEPSYLGEGTGDQKGMIGGMLPLNPADDEDYYLVSNVAIMFPNITTDLEAQVVKIIWPYKVVPVSQATNLSIIGRVANMGTVDCQPFNVKVRVFDGELPFFSPDYTPPADQAIYCQSITEGQGSIKAGQAKEFTFSGFNARNFATFNNMQQNVFTLQMVIEHTNVDGDLYSRNDTVYSHFKIIFGDAFSYTDLEGNEVADAVGIHGKGLNLAAASFGGFIEPAPPGDVNKTTDRLLLGNNTMYAGGRYWNFWSGFTINSSDHGWVEYVCGGNLADLILGYPGGGYVSGQIAMKFELSSADTLKGFRVKFGSANMSFDDISFNIYNNALNKGSDIPGTPINNGSTVPVLYARRLMNKSANGNETIVTDPNSTFVNYELPNPIRLDAGVYWMSINQLGHTGLELAATRQSMGMKTMRVQAVTSGFGGEVGNIGILGNDGIQLMLDKNFRKPSSDNVYSPYSPSGRIYVNNNVFAYRNVMHSINDWQPFMPTIGQVAYPHLNHLGTLPATSPTNNSYNSFSRGTWAPLIKPVFGLKTLGNDPNYYPCPEDDPNSNPTAIEVVAFGGYVRNGGIDINWETVFEENIHSFIVERANLNEDVWTEVGVEAAARNSTATNVYRMRDENVEPGNTYRYRLYSMSVDGVLSCAENHIITVEFEDINTAITLEQNVPNPFTNETRISFNVPTSQKVTLEILDIFGKVVKTLVNAETLKGNLTYMWNGRDNNEMRVVDGHYFYRLTAGETIINKKLTFISNSY